MGCCDPSNVVPASRTMIRFAFAPCGGLRILRWCCLRHFLCLWGIFFFVFLSGVLEDDHSPVGGSDDTNAGLFGLPVGAFVCMLSKAGTISFVGIYSMVYLRYI